MDGAPSHTFQSHFKNPNSHFPALPITEKSVNFPSAKKAFSHTLLFFLFSLLSFFFQHQRYLLSAVASLLLRQKGLFDWFFRFYLCHHLQQLQLTTKLFFLFPF